MNKKISVFHICMIALAVSINFVGGQIALMLRLPIYLDSIGTFFIAAVCGPVYGMIPNLLSGLILGMTTDIYSLYYAPVGILLGLCVGLVFRRYGKNMKNIGWILLGALLVAVPTSVISSCITAILFGGITSSGSTILMQLLSKTKLGLTASCIIVQFATDYLDRIISLSVVLGLLKVLPKSLISGVRYGKNAG